MAITAYEIQQLIQAALPDATVHVDDLAGDGDHYAVRVTSTKFTSKSRVQQHQMVYEALGGRVGDQLHALSIQTCLPNIAPTSLSIIESES